MELERIPQAIDCERMVLSSILNFGDELMNECIELGLKTDAFSTQKHRIIYDALLRLHARQEPLELTSLYTVLSNDLTLEECGGAAQLATMLDGVPRTDSVEYYVRTVQQAARRRKLFQACNLAGNLLLEGTDESFAEAQAMIQSAMGEVEPNKFSRIGDLITRYLTDMEDRAGNKALGISTGFMEYDQRTHGLQRGELVVLAGRPSNGKTTLAMNIAENVAVSGLSVAVFSLEMSKMALAEKLISRGAQVDSYRLRGGFFNKTDWQRFLEVNNRFETVRLGLCDDCGLNAPQIKARAHRMASHGLDLIVIDFLQLMSGSKRDQNRFEMVGENAREMKNLARELNVSVVLLSQLNRSVESRTDPEPQLSDLRESGEIEQVADVIAFLYHEKMDDDVLITVKLGKNRNGAQGSFKLMYNRAINRFDSLP